MSRGWNFEVVEVDAKRIFQVKVERLLGFFEGEDGEEDGDESLVRGFFNRKSSENDDDDVGVNGEGDEESAAILAAAAVAVESAAEEGLHAEAISRQARVSNTLEANRVERLVEQNEMKVAKVKDEKQASE